MTEIVKTSGGRDVTTTGDYKALLHAPTQAQHSLAGSLINLIPMDVLLPLVISAALKIATSGTGTRSKQIKKVLIQVAQSTESTFPGEVCG
jgi:hypothetical protein